MLNCKDYMEGLASKSIKQNKQLECKKGDYMEHDVDESKHLATNLEQPKKK